jgi:hypothetical protein
VAALIATTAARRSPGQTRAAAARTVDMVLRLLTPLGARPGVTTLAMPPSRA